MTKDRLKALSEAQAKAKEIVRDFLPFVEVSKYGGSLNDMVEDLWFRIFCDPVSEVCEEALAEDGSGGHGDK